MLLYAMSTDMKCMQTEFQERVLFGRWITKDRRREMKHQEVISKSFQSWSKLQTHVDRPESKQLCSISSHPKVLDNLAVVLGILKVVSYKTDTATHSGVNVQHSIRKRRKFQASKLGPLNGTLILL
uniref:Ovule protein n=1 Tax=Steinernema glaseri TaxID=37863 RepID=A0A1I7Z6G4_9BILA